MSSNIPGNNETNEKYLINCQEGANNIERATISFILAVTSSKTLASVLGLLLSLRVHHNWYPLLFGCLGTGLIVYVMTVEYHLVAEIFGFVLLCSAVLWDWKIQRRRKV